MVQKNLFKDFFSASTSAKIVQWEEIDTVELNMGCYNMWSTLLHIFGNISNTLIPALLHEITQNIIIYLKPPQK